MTLGDLNFRFGATGADDVERASEKAESSLRDLEDTQERVSDSSAGLSTQASSTATNLGFEFTQAAQDAKFGAAGLANQIPLISEQFQRLRSQTGSTTGALGSLATAFTGPTGVIAAVTLLLTFQDELVGFFTDAGDAAKNASDQVDALSSAADKLITVDTGIETRDIDSLSQARDLLSRFQQEAQGAEEEVGALKTIIDDIQGPEIEAGVDPGQLGSTVSALEDTDVTLQEIRSALQGGEEDVAAFVSRIEEQIAAEEEAAKTLNEQVDTLKDAIREAETLQDVYDQLPQSLRETETQINSLADELAALAGEDLSEGPSTIGGQLEQLQQQAEDAGQGVGASLEGAAPEISAAGTEAFDIQGVQRFNDALSVTQLKLRAVGTQLRRSLEGTFQRLFRGGIDVLSGFIVGLEDAGSAAKALQRIFQRVMQRIISQLITAALKALFFKGILAGIGGGGPSAFGGIVSPGISGQQILSGASGGANLVARSGGGAQIAQGQINIPVEVVNTANVRGQNVNSRTGRG